MTPPSIRYPLPSLLALVVLGLIAWKGEQWTRPLRASLSRRLETAISGPEVPHSDAPQRLIGPITRRVLLMSEDVSATDRPDGRSIDTIRSRGFVDVYDVWPPSGPATHFRVGNRRPIGWVKAVEVLDWPTRLVVRPKSGTIRIASAWDGDPEVLIGVDDTPLPVLKVEDLALLVAVWEAGRSWSAVSRSGWIAPGSLTPEERGVLMSQDELLILLGEMMRPSDSPPTSAARWRSIFGRLGDPRPTSKANLDLFTSAYPGLIAKPGDPPLATQIEALSRINEQWSPEASWSGIGFRFIPLRLLPR